ncbi:MAG: TolC family protein [Hyphomicrobium sp.]|nr:TolC family protein [Hyphomicrobium sp.]
MAQPIAAPDDPRGAVPLAVALDAAWARATAAREADGRMRVAEAERSAASSLWPAAPALLLSHRNDRLPGARGNRESEAGLALPLWLPSQRAARRAAAESTIDLTQADIAAERLRLAGELRDAAWSLQARVAEKTAAYRQAQSLTTLADDTERRVRAGDLAPADALSARAELLAARALSLEADQQIRVARSRWAQLTGLTTDPDLSTVRAEAVVPAAPDHPELRQARQAVEQARRRADLFRASRRDPPELSIGVRREQNLNERAQNGVVVGFRLPFGTDARNQPLEAAALSALGTAEVTLARLQERLEIETATARATVAGADEQLEAETARSRLLRERAELIDRSFRAGETALPELLRALAAAAQAEGAVVRQQAALGLARARLEQALGWMP